MRRTRPTSQTTDPPGPKDPAYISKDPAYTSKDPPCTLALWYDPAVAFARWDPVGDLLAIHQRLDRLSAGQADWRPPVDLHETPDEYVVTAELPGLSTADIEVRFEDGRLTLTGVRRQSEAVCEQYHRVERGHGRFSRSFQLPHPIESGAIAADMRDGVLTVRCPKSSADGPRHVHIS